MARSTFQARQDIARPYLAFQLTSLLSVSKYKAAELVGILVEKLDNTTIDCQEKFYENDSAIIDHEQGHLFWNGKIQHMNYAIGMPKRLHVILEERGIDAKGMNGRSNV